jgi:ABC-type glycerol-3-phosphate transport system substrate-binding protein
MQQITSEPVPPPAHWWLIGLSILVAIGIYFGWQVEGPTIPTAPSLAHRVHDGVTLNLACSNPVLKKALVSHISSWSGETGAKILWQPDIGAATDLAIVTAPELGSLASNNQLKQLPTEYQSGQHLAQWNRIAVTYRLELAQWGGTIFALPVASDPSVLVIRADKLNNPQHVQAFAKKYAGRRLGLPAVSSWEECLDVAEYFQSVDGKPSLPPLPRDSRRFQEQFLQIAACYDRPAAAEELLVSQGFFFDTATGRPLLTNKPFVSAAEWMSQASKYRLPSMPDSTTSDQFRAIVEGSAVLAVLTLSEVGNLPRDASGEVDPRFAVTRLPGTRSWFSPKGERVVSTQPNYVPYLGNKTSLGVVFDRKNPEKEAIAWSLLIKLCEPATHSELLGNPDSGVGPIREDQLGNNDRDPVWFNFRFDSDRNAKFADAVRNYAPRTVSRPVLAIRSPDQSGLLSELENQMRAVASGQVSATEGIRRAQDGWERLLSTQSSADVKRWRQSDSGVR